MNQCINYELLGTFRRGHQIADLKNYFKVIELHKKGFGQKQIKNKVMVSLDKIYRWRYTNSKPLCVKIINEFNGRYNRQHSNKEFQDIAYLVGYNLGDGNISKNFCNTWFYGVYDDLFNIKNILLKFNVKPMIYRYKINNGKMAVHNNIFSRFLYIYGAVNGDKTKNKVIVPEWILKSKNKEIKRKFLQGLFDSELSKISKIKNKNSYQHLKFDNCKVIDKTKDGVFFLNQIIRMLKEFGIKTSKIYFDRKYKRSRDNSKMQQLYFIIHSNYINLYNFITKIGFLYNSKRRKSAIEAFKKIENLAIKEKKKIMDYKKVLMLRKSGLSAYKIAKKLKIRDHLVKQWLYFKTKPRLFNFYSNNF